MQVAQKYLLALAFIIGTTICFGQSNAALIIANFAYKDAPLKTPKADALLIRDSLSSIGFDVTLRENLATQREFVDAIKDFTSRTENSEIRIIYYAGHAMAVDGSNFLMPTEESFNSLEDIEDYGIDVEKIVRYFDNQNVGANILILDSCRDNPFAKSWNLTRSSGSMGGLAKIAAPAGSIIAFSTAYGDVASDGNGSNSPYAESLSKNLTIPNISIERVFALTRESVLDLTSNGQKPIEESQLLGSEILLNPRLTLDNLRLDNLDAFLDQNPSQFSDAFRQLLLKGEKDPDLSVHTVRTWVERQIEDPDAPIWLTMNSLLDNFAEAQLLENNFSSPENIQEFDDTIWSILFADYHEDEDHAKVLSSVVFISLMLEQLQPTYLDEGLIDLLILVDDFDLTWLWEEQVDRIMMKDSILPHEFLLLSAPLIRQNLLSYEQDWNSVFADESVDDSTFIRLNHLDFTRIPCRQILTNEIQHANEVLDRKSIVSKTNWSPLDSVIQDIALSWLSVDVETFTYFLTLYNFLSISGSINDRVSIQKYDHLFQKYAVELIRVQSNFMEKGIYLSRTDPFFYINQLRNWAILYELESQSKWNEIAQGFVESFREYQSLDLEYSDQLRLQIQFNPDFLYSTAVIDGDPEARQKHYEKFLGSIPSSKKYWTFYAEKYPKSELDLFSEVNRIVRQSDSLTFLLDVPTSYTLPSSTEDFNFLEDIELKQWIDYIETPILDTVSYRSPIFKRIVQEERNSRIQQFFSQDFNRALARVKFNEFQTVSDILTNTEIPKIWSELHRIFETSSSQELISTYIDFLLTIQTSTGYWVDMDYFSSILYKVEDQTDQPTSSNLERSLQSLEYVISDMTTSWRINECEGCPTELRLLSRRLNRILNN
jgi:hypothetical protein